jgi:hypothetical protein
MCREFVRQPLADDPLLDFDQTDKLHNRGVAESIRINPRRERSLEGDD